MMSRHLVPASQQPRAVLPEEEYQRNLSEVIQRQYYPDLVDLQAQASVQKRLEAGDVAGAESVRRAAGLLKFHDALVQQAEIEEEEGDESDGGGYGSNLLRSKPRPLHLETLTGFHARVTSEDNADFETAQTEEMRQNRIERAKMLLLTTSAEHGGSQQPAPNPQQPLWPGGETPLFLASDAFDAPPSATRPKAKEAPVENGFFFVPSIVEPSRMYNEEDSNQKLLMPPPSSKTTQRLAATASAASATTPTIANALVEYIPKNYTEKRIEPANTRFPAQSQLTNLITSSLGSAHFSHRHLEGDTEDEESTHSSFRDGSPAGAATDSETDLDRDSVDGSSVTSDRLHELRRQAQKRKEREWQTLVPLSPAASVAGNDRRDDVNQSLAMDPSSSSSSQSSSFQLPPTLPREVVAERAHELSQRRSKRAGQVSSSASSARSRRIGGDSNSNSRHLFSSASASDAPSVRSALSRSGSRGPVGRPESSSAGRLMVSRSALGTALRSAYGGGSIGPASVGGGSVSARSRSSASSINSGRDRSGSSSAGRPRVAK
jgi:Nuclear protein Es2